MSQKAFDVAQILIKSGCVQLNVEDPFRYASGLRGPIYCDNRLLLGHTSPRNSIVARWSESLREEVKNRQLCGIATAGIPWASMLADRLSCPFSYIRSAPKQHGKGRLIEGKYQKGEEFIFIEDLINQGASSLQAIQLAKTEGVKPVAIYSIVSYGFDIAHERLLQEGVNVYSLTNFESLVNVAMQMELITKEDKKSLEAWHNDPKKWSETLA